MNTGASCNTGVRVHQHSQVITDDFVESLTEISSFFMPQEFTVIPVEYVNDFRKSVSLESNVMLAEIATQQIMEYGANLSVRLTGTILEGFSKPLAFTFLLSHTLRDAKIFKGRNHLQTFALSEFLRLEYPPLQLVLTDTLFSLHFSSDKTEQKPIVNGGGCLLFDEFAS